MEVVVAVAAVLGYLLYSVRTLLLLRMFSSLSARTSAGTYLPTFSGRPLINKRPDGDRPAGFTKDVPVRLPRPRRAGSRLVRVAVFFRARVP